MTKKKMVNNTKAVSVLLKKFILLRKIEGTLQGKTSRNLFFKDIFCSLLPNREQNNRRITNFDPLGDKYLQTSFLSSGNRQAPEAGAFSGNQAKSPE